MRYSVIKNKTRRIQSTKSKKIVDNIKKSKKRVCVTKFGNKIGNLKDVSAYSNSHK